MESRIERLCVERGLKMTGQRRVIARVLSDAGDHPDVEELYRRAAALDPRISIATVYRTVRLFEEHGILERRDFGGGRARYEPTEHGHHHHLIDVDTGRVIEFSDAEHERVLQPSPPGWASTWCRTGWNCSAGARRAPAARPPAEPASRRDAAAPTPAARRVDPMTARIAVTATVRRRPMAGTRVASANCAAAISACASPPPPPKSTPPRRCATACSTRRWAP